MIQIAARTPNVAAIVMNSLQDQVVGYSDPDNAINSG